jgi:hypothetical protein
VVRRHVIAALATGLRFGDEDAARRALGGVDWIVRGPARRRFERALIDAALATGAWATSGDPSATAHVLRVALLRTHGVRAVDAADAAAVERAAAALPVPPAPTTRPTLTAVAAAAGALLVTLALLTILVGPAPVDHAAYARPLPPASAGAYRTGGRPLADPALETLLRKDLADLIVATDRAVNHGDLSDADRVGRHAALQAPAAIVAHGPALAGAWRAMLDALDHWAHLIPADPGWDRAVAELRAGARGVSDQLAALGLGYFVDGDVVLSRGLRHAIIYAYRVEHVAFVAAGGKSQRVLGLRRVDHVNLARTLLGMQSEDLGDPLLLLDQIDEHVATHLLAVLADDGRYPLGDARWRAGALGTELGIVAGAAIRTELYAALGADADAARTVGNLTSARGELLDRWREYLQLHDLTLRPVDTALLPSSYLPSLAPVLPSDQRAQMAALDAEMADVGVPRIAARLHDLVAATVRRHEAQHAFDAARPAPLSQPTSLQMLVGPAELGDGVERRLARAARNELSAYVSQIASDPATPHLALWALARSAFDRGRWGRPEAYVATVVISGLARELDVPSAGVLVKDGKIDRDRLELLAVAVAGKTSDEVRAAAGRLWASLFDEPYLAVVDVAPAGGATANVANAGTTPP